MLYLNSGILSSGGWMHAKLVFLVLMIGYHISLDRIRKIMIQDPHYKTSKYLRVYNEIPTLLMIGIVIMVVVKPF
jgi:putative membrane protein